MRNLFEELGMIDIKKVDIKKMIGFMLYQPWHRNCDIIPDYIRPNDKKKEEIVIIRYNSGSEHPPFLRHSAGPKNDFFWDIYGDNFKSVELAIIALSKAPFPVNVDPISFSLSLPKRK